MRWNAGNLDRIDLQNEPRPGTNIILLPMLEPYQTEPGLSADPRYIMMQQQIQLRQHQKIQAKMRQQIQALQYPIMYDQHLAYPQSLNMGWKSNLDKNYN